MLHLWRLLVPVDSATLHSPLLCNFSPAWARVYFIGLGIDEIMAVWWCLLRSFRISLRHKLFLFEKANLWSFLSHEKHLVLLGISEAHRLAKIRSPDEISPSGGNVWIRLSFWEGEWIKVYFKEADCSKPLWQDDKCLLKL